MRKLRSDSKWHKLPSKAREQIIQWLFEKGMSYEAVLECAEKEFGIRASKSSICRFYQHVAEERELAGLHLSAGSPEEFRAAALKLLGAPLLSTPGCNLAGQRSTNDSFHS